MSVDNLPAQLPRDATEYFGSRLLPIIEGLAREGIKERHVAGATIVSQGQLGERHRWLQDRLATAGKKRRVLILGSGYVAGPVVKHLGARSDVEVLLASDKGAEAERVAGLARHGARVHVLDINDPQKLGALVAKADVVISLIPATMHLPVAQACLEHAKHLVTASYISPQMQALGDSAKAKGLIFLNEIGLDPGLDHLSARQLIDLAHAEGAKVVGFTSWCGGLPAPECADNPLGYKFSWSPRGVLLAAMNDARYRLDGKTIQIKGPELLAAARTRPFKSPLALEGLPNRDSLKYLDLYGLPHAQTMLRGTLRYEGFSSLMRAFRALGLFDLDPLAEDLARCTNWADVIAKLTRGHCTIADAALTATISASRLNEALHWLGMLSATEPFSPAVTLLDSFCDLLQKKLRYGPGERDMVVMQHGFILEGGREGRQLWGSSLIEYGEPQGFSAMARTVGYPVALAAEMILEGQVQERGVLAPLSSAIYEPMLKGLAAVAGIRFRETRSQLQ